jgi:cell pole-organizing protein PopZ
MEEILASIRKIISEDSPEAQPAPEPSRPAAAPVMAADADVLDLTQEVEEAPPMPAPEPVRQVAPPENDVVFEPIEQQAPVAPEPPAASHSPEGIFSDKTRKALDDTFANIDPEQDAMHRAHEPLTAPSVEGLSVEAVFERAVRESFEPVVNQWLGSNADAIVERMKPLIREWMDEHFPALLEGAVRDEVARVARARGTKR